MEAIPRSTSVLIPRQRSRFALVALLCAVVCAWQCLPSTGLTFAEVADAPTTTKRGRTPRSKVSVILLKDFPALGKKDDIKKVKRGYYRNFLFPSGIAVRQNKDEMKRIRYEQMQSEKASAEALDKATKQKEKIEAHGVYIFTKKVREGTDNIYGSLSEINVAEEVVKATATPVKRTSVEIPKVSQLGEYKGRIDLGLGIIANIDIKVVSEGGEDEGEGEEEE